MVVRELIRQWSIQFPDDTLFALVRKGQMCEQMPTNVTQVPTALRPHAVATTRLTSLARRLKADAILAQNFALFGKNTGVFVHDVLFQSNPEYFTRVERLYLALIPKSIRGSKYVFTSSRTESERIFRYNSSAPKVHAVGLAVGTELLKSTPLRPEMPASFDRFVLTVGRLNVRKNLNRVFEAANKSEKLSPACPLLVVGEADGRMSSLGSDLQALVDTGTIRFLGGVSNPELRWLYENSSLLIFASLDEGFGLPPLEALSFGCKIAISEIPVFKEVYGSSAHYFDPTDSTSIALTIDRALNDPNHTQNESASTLHTWPHVVTRIRSVFSQEQTYA